MKEQSISKFTLANFEDDMSLIWLSCGTFRKIEKGSETRVVDINLQRLLVLMLKYANPKADLKCAKISIPNSILSKSCSPEHSLISSNMIVIGCESKGLEACSSECYPQLISVCGDSAIGLLNAGFDIENAVIPGLALSGSGIQFCAVYLMPPNFPVLVALTSFLNPHGSDLDRRLISTWCLRFVHFAEETVELMKKKGEKKSTRHSICKLELSKHFLKPVRENVGSPGKDLIISSCYVRLNAIMNMYELLRVGASGIDHERYKRYFLFPIGVVTIPGESAGNLYNLRKSLIESCCGRYQEFSSLDLDCRPLVVFPLLSTEWRNDRPPAHLCNSYIHELSCVCDALDIVEIAHMDLRPANIMWREVSGSETVELLVIDFEYAVRYGHTIPEQFIMRILGSEDSRFPFTHGDELTRQRASTIHNRFFLSAVSDFLLSDTRSFTEFMETNGQAILQLVRESIIDEAGDDYRCAV